ncbi:type I-B CRISPR-associated protein Cas7/Csh2 [Clostridium ihumii]|uniref:type I-B CRISPR-associated protein Cas7/Csh2 n=1 Tax=Clostridium ihumii TaxID=1470356 RepID=UPI000555DD69|nr:type I-B CRISPR-associated protein Cas7/Csh2 [Clostridium ihumii]
MAKTREILFFSDAIMSNQNGDMINDNRPRTDETTGKLEMTDVRIKRYAREEAINRGIKIFVKPTTDEKGKQMDCKKVAANIIKEELDKKKDKLEQHLKDNYYDVKLFGVVGTTDPKFNVMGPLQVMWSKSIHEAEVKFTQGTSSFSSGDNKTQGTTWSKYYTPYALFKTYMVYNDICAKRQNINVTEEDMELFKDLLITGVRSYKSTSKNQMPRLLLEVIYNENFIDGELDYVKVNYEKSDLELRSIDEFTFDFSELNNFINIHKSNIDKVRIYMHSKVKAINIPTGVEILPL